MRLSTCCILVLVLCFEKTSEASRTSRFLRSSGMLSSLSSYFFGSNNKEDEVAPVSEEPRLFESLKDIKDEFLSLDNPLSSYYEKLNDFMDEKIQKYLLSFSNLVGELKMKVSEEDRDSIIDLIHMMQKEIEETVKKNSEEMDSFFDLNADEADKRNTENIRGLLGLYDKLLELECSLTNEKQDVLVDENDESDQSDAGIESVDESTDDSELEENVDEGNSQVEAESVLLLEEESKDEDSEDSENHSPINLELREGEENIEESEEKMVPTPEEQENEVDQITMTETPMSEEEKKEEVIDVSKKVNRLGRKERVPEVQPTVANEVPSLMVGKKINKINFALYNEKAIQKYYTIRMKNMKNVEEKKALRKKMEADIKQYHIFIKMRGQQELRKKRPIENPLTKPSPKK